jgi:hypothetical protein
LFWQAIWGIDNGITHSQNPECRAMGPNWSHTAVAIIAHPMLSRGNEVANRTNFVAVHESEIAA